MVLHQENTAIESDFDEYLTIDEIASFLNISRFTVRKLIQTEQLPAIRLMKLIRVRKRDLLVFLESRRNTEVFPQGGECDELPQRG